MEGLGDTGKPTQRSESSFARKAAFGTSADGRVRRRQHAYMCAKRRLSYLTASQIEGSFGPLDPYMATVKTGMTAKSTTATDLAQ